MNLSDIKPTEPIPGKEEPKEVSLSIQDLENIIILLQQCKISVGSFPYDQMNSLSKSINKLKTVYETLKNGEQLNAKKNND